MASEITCVKTIVFLCNFLFMQLTGGLILIVGAIVQLNYNHYPNFVEEDLWRAPIVLFVVGAINFLRGLLRCCAAINENSCTKLTCSVIIVVIFLVEVGIGIAGYIKHGELDGILKTEFNKTLEQYNSRVEYRDAWKLIQTELSCCGVNGPDDWNHVFNNNTLPASCCSEIPTHESSCIKVYAHKDGCYDKLLSFLKSNIGTLIAVATALALVQLLAIIYTCCLYRCSRNYQSN